MPLAALILACDDDDGSRGLPCVFKVAGQTLFAHQVRMAKAAGAGHIVALVRQMPTALVLALDALREEGISVDIARDAADAASRIHPQEQLLVMSEGLFSDSETVKRVASSTEPVLLCRAGGDGGPGFERIDAEYEWAGLARLEGALLRETASMAGDWVLGPTLLRLALQAGTQKMLLGDQDRLCFPQSQSEAELAVRALALKPSSPSGSLSKRLVAAVTNRVSPLLMRYEAPLVPVSWAPLLLSGLALVSSATGWLASGWVLFLLSPLIAAHVGVLTRISGKALPALAWYRRLKMPLFCILLLVSGWFASDFPREWGPLVLALWGASGLYFESQERNDALSRPDTDGAAILLLVASLAGQPSLGLATLVGWLLFWQISRRVSRPDV